MGKRTRIGILCITAALSARAGAQGMDHSKMAAAGADKPAAAPASQAAFATIQDIVRKLKADPSTDWSKVNLEGLRQHLVDMDNVVMRSAVTSKNVDGGLSMDITGTGNVAGAIQRMGGMHAQALSDEGLYVAKSSEIDGGVRLVVTAKDPSDAKAVSTLRGLGWAGLLTEGDHHPAHHLMVAKGEAMVHEHKP